LRHKLAIGEALETRHTLEAAYKEFIKHHEKLTKTGESSAAKVKRYEASSRSLCAVLYGTYRWRQGTGSRSLQRQ
jgi:hypothetical protein